MRKGTSSIGIFTLRQGFPSPWIIFALPNLFPVTQLNSHWATRCSDFGTNTALTLELKVLLAAPQANWSLLLKVLRYLSVRSNIGTFKIFKFFAGVANERCNSAFYYNPSFNGESPRLRLICQ